MSDNPYAAPMELDVPASPLVGDEKLARRFARFAAAICDGFLVSLINLPIQFGTGFFQRSQAMETSSLEQLAMALLGSSIFLVLQGYLLATRGQSIGKMLTNIQIVDYETKKLLPFVRVCILRHLWTLPLAIVCALIPGFLDDLLLSFVVLFDILFIFNAERRCLHDFIAGSRVVEYRAGREHLS